MKKLIIISFIMFFNTSNVLASVYKFDGVLDIYTGATHFVSTRASGDFSFSGEAFKSDFTGTFTSELFGSPISGDLIIPNSVDNPVLSPLTIGNSTNDLLLQVDFTSLDSFQITTLDGDGDGVPGSVFSSGPNPTSYALSGEFSVVPLPSAFWLFGSGIMLSFNILRRQSKNKNS